MNCRFFDHNATTPLSGAAREAWLEAVEGAWLNPSSPNRAAAAVKVKVEAAREALAARFDVAAERVVFNSGATEGNNTVFAYWARVFPAEAKVAVSPTEHPSVIEAAKFHFDGRLIWLALDAVGAVDVAALDRLLESEQGIAAVSVMAANNETGILNDWQAIAACCRQRHLAYHCDASQWVGKLPLEGFAACDFLSACGHKFGGPRGVGFLVVPTTAGDYGFLRGGWQEAGLRAGTEDVAGILAMVAALDVLTPGAADGRDRFVARLSESLAGVEFMGLQAERLWNTVSLLLPEFESARWIRGLEKRGFLVSAGSACATGKAGPSHVLAAHGVDAAKTRRSLRVSSGWATSVDDWDALADALLDVYIWLKKEGSQASAEVISI